MYSLLQRLKSLRHGFGTEFLNAYDGRAAHLTKRLSANFVP